MEGRPSALLRSSQLFAEIRGVVSYHGKESETGVAVERRLDMIKIIAVMIMMIIIIITTTTIIAIITIMLSSSSPPPNTVGVYR